MPCNSDHMRADEKEKEFSKVACLLDELDGKGFVKSSWEGYHPNVYDKEHDGDTALVQLCNRLRKVDVTAYSLEMQMWWRDHQEIDRIKEAELLDELEAERLAVIIKLTKFYETLTKRERVLIGFEKEKK